ncbi:MAG: oligosaccharide flippase family protein [Candidatus Daviesbacteria bacterium]
MEIIKKVFQQTSWQLLGKVFTSLSSIIVLGLVTRTYGSFGTGIFTLALAYLGFFYIMADFGLNTHVLPTLLGPNLSINFRKLFGLRLFLTLILVILAIIIILLWPNSQGLFKTAVLIGIPAIIGSAILTTVVAIFQAKLRYDLSFFSTLAAALASLLTTWVVVSWSLQTPALLSNQVLGFFAAGVLGLILISKFTPIWPIVDFSYIKTTLLTAWPISATLILNLVYFRADAFILSAFKSFAEVGIYNVAYQIFQSLLVVPGFIMNSFYPLILKDFNEDRPEFISNLTKAILIMFAIAFVGTILTLLFSGGAIDLITGQQGFSGSAKALQMLSLSFPAFFVTSVLMLVLIIFRKYKTMLLIYLGGLIFNILANLIFIPAYSYIGAALVTVFSEYLILVAQLIIIIPLLRPKDAKANH